MSRDMDTEESLTKPSKAVGSSVQEESRSDWKEPEEVESVEDVVFKPVLPVNEAVFSGSHFTNLNSKHSVSH